MKALHDRNELLNFTISIVMDTILAYLCTLLINQYSLWVVATRQHSSNGKPKSPRVQVVLPEETCQELAALASQESRTVSNMAKVLIQEGLKKYEKRDSSQALPAPNISNTEGFRNALEAQEPKRLKGAPRRLRIYRPS